MHHHFWKRKNKNLLQSFWQNHHGFVTSDFRLAYKREIALEEKNREKIERKKREKIKRKEHRGNRKEDKEKIEKNS